MASGKNSNHQKAENNWKESLILYLHDLLYMLTAVLLVFLLFFRVIVVSGDSMYSTLLDGDYLLLLGNLFYEQPEHGDIVVISKDSFDNGAPIVKRVIATEGQYVKFVDGKVYVGDSLNLEEMQLLDEPYISSPTVNQQGYVKVQEGCILQQYP